MSRRLHSLAVLLRVSACGTVTAVTDHGDRADNYADAPAAAASDGPGGSAAAAFPDASRSP